MERYDLHVYSARSQLNNCSVPVVDQVTVHNKCSKCPPSESVLCLDTSEQGR